MTINPTQTQVEIIRYFAGLPSAQCRSNQTTYKACERNGWIEPIDEFPFHRTTPAGLAAIGANDELNERLITQIFS